MNLDRYILEAVSRGNSGRLKSVVTLKEFKRLLVDGLVLEIAWTTDFPDEGSDFSRHHDLFFRMLVSKAQHSEVYIRRDYEDGRTRFYYYDGHDTVWHMEFQGDTLQTAEEFHISGYRAVLTEEGMFAAENLVEYLSAENFEQKEKIRIGRK